eukprot:CAMPEP_0202862070 /NCGR_PEP_ID=MMETSP1391-20130828/3248_1 /ASSEMBLY_ACC=CAM_ASM_000867 /TAXON_ID=1034604 /ORGANISM="Chlamydomonas leiostraca, Strain SAG 11-49" /LENGTH=249 /DNA_ID=CAMNT_0049541553 /DNA_START=198 /DNA_END=943 /DNA_ORIENTATION=-
MGTSRPSKATWSLLLMTLALATLHKTGQAQEAPVLDQYDETLDLQAQPEAEEYYFGPEDSASSSSSTYNDDYSSAGALLVFPFCRCVDYRCNSSPWKLIPQPLQTPAPGVSVMCFKFMFVGCAFTSDCCTKLSNDVGKVEFAVDKVCQKNIFNTTLNGYTKKGSTYFDMDYAQGKLTVTKLQMIGKSNIQNSELCLWLKSPCDTVDGLFADHDGTFKSAIFNSKHDCCPVCMGPDKPPPPPMPPSPPPP